eukprot:scaffold37088_cov42-Phaeocystis_antarctica.AAC.1
MGLGSGSGSGSGSGLGLGPGLDVEEGDLGGARELEGNELGLISRDLEAGAAEAVAELDVGHLVDLLGRVDVLHVVVEGLAQQQAL